MLDNAPTIANLTVTSSITLPARSVADAALSTNVSLKNAPNVFTGQVTFKGGFVYQNDDEDVRLRINIATGGRIYFAPWYNGAYNFNREFGFDPAAEKWYAEGIDINGGAGISGTLAVGGASTFSGTVTVAKSFDFSDVGYGLRLVSADPGIEITETAAAADNQKWAISADEGVFRISALTDAHAFTHALEIARSGGTPTTISFSSGAVRAATIATSTSTTLAAGQVHAITSNATLPNMSAGQWVGVINNSASPITVTKNASDTMYWTASGSSVTSITVAARGKATFICADGTNVYASGNILGSS